MAHWRNVAEIHRSNVSGKMLRKTTLRREVMEKGPKITRDRCTREIGVECG